MANETYHPRGVLVHGYKPREHPLYPVWASMKARCRNPKEVSYPNYGGRGIDYCQRWAHFANFAEDMWPRPSDEHMIERIDNNKNYGPDNCKWADRFEQMRNRRQFSNNKTGFTGVLQKGPHFVARYDDHKKRYKLGQFTTLEAAVAYRERFINLFNAGDMDAAMAMTERRARSDSSIGIKGITINRQKGGDRYFVRVTEGSERIYLGSFLSLDAAKNCLDRYNDAK